MQCKAKTAKGERCKHNAHGPYCGVHAPKKSPSYKISRPRRMGPHDAITQRHIEQLIYFIMSEDYDFVPDERYVTRDSYSLVWPHLPRLLNEHQKRRLNFVKQWSKSK